MPHKLKRLLYDSYGGFADKRIKDLAKSSIFIVDDRDQYDEGANGDLRSHFCLIFADVKSENSVMVNLRRNVPTGAAVKKWLKKKGLEIRAGLERSLEFEVVPADYDSLDELADAVEAIVAPGAPRYAVSSYKYVCPRIAKSLRKLKSVLDRAWPDGEPIKVVGFNL